jgi:hypothetical protein
MTKTQFGAALDRLGLTQVGAARLFGYDERTIRRWASGELPVPRIIEVVLYLIETFKVKVSRLPW